MIDFNSLQNPIEGTAQNVADPGDLVSVRTAIGNIRAEALTEISSINVIVAKDTKTGKYYAIGQSSQVISEEITQKFKSRLQPRISGLTESVALFAEVVDVETPYISPDLSYELIERGVNSDYGCLLVPRSSFDADDKATCEASVPNGFTPLELSHRSYKFWLKIDSVSDPIEVATYPEFEPLRFWFGCTLNQVVVVFKVGIAAFVSEECVRVDVFSFNYSGVRILAKSYTNPQPFNFPVPDIVLKVYLSNYFIDSAARYEENNACFTGLLTTHPVQEFNLEIFTNTDLNSPDSFNPFTPRDRQRLNLGDAENGGVFIIPTDQLDSFLLNGRSWSAELPRPTPAQNQEFSGDGDFTFAELKEFLLRRVTYTEVLESLRSEGSFDPFATCFTSQDFIYYIESSPKLGNLETNSTINYSAVFYIALNAISTDRSSRNRIEGAEADAIFNPPN